jgi:hypothetical protein
MFRRVAARFFDTVERVWDAMERYLTVMSLMTMQLKGLVDPVDNRNLVDMSVGLVGDDVNYSCFVVVKELSNFVRNKGSRLLRVDVVKVAEYVMETVSGIQCRESKECPVKLE